MSPAISAPQRDALYEQILDRLSGIGDIEVAIQAERYDTAERLGREYCDDLRLVLDDLGFGEGSGQPLELSASPEVLRRVLPRMRELAKGHVASVETQWVEAQEMRERSRLVAEACDTVLAGLEGA